MASVMPEKSIMNVKAMSPYSEITGKKYVFLLVIVFLISIIFLIDVMTGPASLSIGEVASTIFFPAASDISLLLSCGRSGCRSHVMAVLIGAVLGLAGANMQTILDKALASPYTRGSQRQPGKLFSNR